MLCSVYVQWKLPVFYEPVAVSSGALQKLHVLLKCAIAFLLALYEFNRTHTYWTESGLI